MNSETITALASVGSFVAAAGSVAVALAAWRASRASAGAALALSDVEKRRELSDLRPQFEATLEEDDDRATLRLQLVGPLSLGKLDSVRVSIRDDVARHVIVESGPSEADIKAHVWGAYRFKEGAEGTDRNGRYVAPFALPLGEEKILLLRTQRPPFWEDSRGHEAWRDRYRDKPLKLKLECEAKGIGSWVIPYEVVRATTGLSIGSQSFSFGNVGQLTYHMYPVGDTAMPPSENPKSAPDQAN